MLKSWGKDGIALISTIIIAGFLIALTGAFLTVNHSHFAILRNSEEQKDAQRAAQAGLEYALYSLEHERTWGVSTTGDIPVRGGGGASAAFADLEILSASAGVTEARYKPLDAKLTIRVENNLNSAPLDQADIDDALAIGNVPNEHAKIVVQAELPTASHRAEAMVRLAPLYEDTLYANGSISIDADLEFTAASLDPFRNSLTATGDVYLPEVSNDKSRFMLPDDSGFDSKGVLKSNGQIFNRTPSSDTRITGSDIQKTGGRVLEEVERKFSFYDLEPADLPVAGESTQTRVEIASGEYRFTRSRAVASYRVDSGGVFGGSSVDTVTADVDVLEYYENPGDTTPSAVFRSFRRLHSMSSGTRIVPTTTFQYSDGSTVGVGDANFLSADIASYVALDTPDGVPRAISGSEARSGAYRVVINLDKQEFNVAKNTQVVPKARSGEATFQVTNKPGVYAQTPGAAFVTPTLNLGSSGEDVSIRAEGDVELSYAKTKGVGTIVSEKGNVALRPIANGSFNVNSPDDGLAVYAKKDVTVSNPGGADWNFNGFVYAGDDFIFDADPHGDGASNDVSFRGSVVAKNESESGDPDEINGIHVANARKVKLFYDPEHLKFLNRNLKNSAGESRDIALEYLYRKL